MTLSYDPLLRIYQVSAGTTTSRFAYDGANAIAEYDGSNALQQRTVFGPGVDEDYGDSALISAIGITVTVHLFRQ